MKQLAFFGEMSYDLTDKWSVTGGARWFEFDRDMFDLYQIPLGLPAQSDPDANGLTSKSTDSDTTFKFSTEYHFTPDVMAYALYSEGFRLGGAELAARGRHRRGAAHLRAGLPRATTRSASRANGSTTGSSSTSRPS